MVGHSDFTTTRLGRGITALCLIAAVMLSGCSPAQKVVATIDGENITIAQLRARINSYDDSNLPVNPAAPGPKTELATAEAALNQLINERLLLIEARRCGFLPDQQTTPAQREEARRRILSELGKNVAFPSYREARNYYEKNRSEFATGPRYQIDHLLISSEDQAWKLKAKLDKGKLSVAEACRLHTGIQPADKLHDHLITGAEMPDEIAKILPRLKPHRISRPIATPYGYHLIRINKKLPAGIIPFAEVENQIKDKLFAARLQKNYQHWLRQSREQHSIKVYHQHLAAFF